MEQADMVTAAKCGLLPCDEEKPRVTRKSVFWEYPHHPMVTHTIVSYRIPSQNKRQSKLKIWKICQKNHIYKNIHATYFPKLPDRMYKYEMDPVSIVADSEGTWLHSQTDGGMDRMTDRKGEISIPPPPPPCYF